MIQLLVHPLSKTNCFGSILFKGTFFLTQLASDWLPLVNIGLDCCVQSQRLCKTCLL